MEVSQTAIIAILALLLVAALVLWWLYRSRRTAALRERFGTEYDRTLKEKGARGKAEGDLIERQERVAKLELRPLGPAERDRFVTDWKGAKNMFVDDVAAAVLDADRVLSTLMGARGFPVADFNERFESLTVDHADVARHYRAGHEIAERQARGEASTEDLRQAMIHYEALFDELAHDTGVPEGAVSRAAQRS
jgi:hypothetical protein